MNGTTPKRKKMKKTYARMIDNSILCLSAQSTSIPGPGKYREMTKGIKKCGMEIKKQTQEHRMLTLLARDGISEES
jgi:hypothetical protein